VLIASARVGVFAVNPICIVDDDDAVRDSLRALLETHRLEVCDFPSADALLANDRLGAFACFVVDFQMPGMNGLELVEALRARGARQRAIVISAAKAAPSEQRARQAGVVAWLVKPVPETELMGWISRAIESPHASLQ
jgi:two-component system, LuxR family, response regulator FixJ